MSPRCGVLKVFGHFPLLAQREKTEDLGSLPRVSLPGPDALAVGAGDGAKLQLGIESGGAGSRD